MCVCRGICGASLPLVVHMSHPPPNPREGRGNLGKDRARDGGEEHINGQTLRGDLGWGAGDEPLSAGERMLDGVKADFSG